jgi:hypothetical protein
MRGFVFEQRLWAHFEPKAKHTVPLSKFRRELSPVPWAALPLSVGGCKHVLGMCIVYHCARVPMGTWTIYVCVHKCVCVCMLVHLLFHVSSRAHVCEMHPS